MSRRILAALVATFGLTFAGCKEKQAPESAPPPFDPVASYRAFLTAELADFKKQLPETTFDDNFKMDVQKTDSLVSPFVGTCVLKTERPMMYRDGKVKVVYSIVIKITYGFQENKWSMTHADGTVQKADVVKNELQYDYTDIIKSKLKSKNYKAFDFDNGDMFIEFMKNGKF